MGRPRKSPAELRDTRTAVMLTEAERAQLEQQASLYGVTLSEFIRRRTLGQGMPATVADSRSRAALATALLRIGVNLNQVVHDMHRGRYDSYRLPDLIVAIRAHVDRLTRDESRQDRPG